MADLRVKLSRWGVMIVRGVTEGGGGGRREGLERWERRRERRGGRGDTVSSEVKNAKEVVASETQQTVFLF
ncbi:hypothetical protein E2C01_032880 [Portunus trituberculatus]|uniref:Uncharacterized protein n=1 Tax=Portunus trituberculatus TaxID=210409 RepID=A0A5B7F1X2_PORTR|nr:hypothetical protein [Portunus trituberculatus]